MAEQNACAENLGANILNDCNDDYGKGVEKIVYIIKKEDIDRKDCGKRNQHPRPQNRKEGIHCFGSLKHTFQRPHIRGSERHNRNVL